MSKQERFRKAQVTHNQRENDKLYSSTQTVLNNCMFNREGRQRKEERKREGWRERGRTKIRKRSGSIKENK